MFSQHDHHHHHHHHPPEVVTLSRSGTGVHTPETESPLSSAPNSPHSSHQGMFASSANLLQELLQQEKQAQKQRDEEEQKRQQQQKQEEKQSQPQPNAAALPLSLDAAPFDEAVDESNHEGGDELMGQGLVTNTHIRIPIPSSRPNITSRSNRSCNSDEDDESEPPSLAVIHRTPVKLEVQHDDQPGAITTAALSGGMVLTTENQMMMTPLQELPSPPPLIKQTMPWEAAMVSPETVPVPVPATTTTTVPGTYTGLGIGTEAVPGQQEEMPMDESQKPLIRVDSDKENPMLEPELDHIYAHVLTQVESHEESDKQVPSNDYIDDDDDDDDDDNSNSNSYNHHELQQQEMDDDFGGDESGEFYGQRPRIPLERASTDESQPLEKKQRPNLKGHRSASEPVLNDWNKYLKNYRQMTPKKDLNTSEKSAAWLQEEFTRRSTMKQEINSAILARNNNIQAKEDVLVEETDGGISLENSFVVIPEDQTGGLPQTPPSPSPPPPPETQPLQDDFAVALSKALEALPPNSSPDYKVDLSQHSEDDEVAALTTAVTIPSDEDGPAPRRLDYEYQQDMQRFADDTRMALRESETGFRSLASDSPPRSETRLSALSRMSNVTEDSDIDITMTPVLVHSMDSYLGIAKGDITLSLLNEDTQTPLKATWANRVQVAIWRCRRMRRNMGGIPVLSNTATRSSLPVDMDNARVAGGIRNVQTTQEAALRHLQQDEIEEAMELFEDIIFAYYAYFERTLQAREANPGLKIDGITDFRPYIGVALHNLGILNLLKGQYREALSYFGRALDNRRSSLGEGHPDHVASLVKYAICLYALNEFADAHAKLEQALVYARNNSQDLGDRMQRAEILNNLGCLAYMCGQPVAANNFFREALDVQFAVLSHSLYLSSAAVGQSISLNISILRANIGFIKLVTKDIPVAVTALENALMEQQLLLLGANDTLMATMDHLALANLLNGDPQKAAMMFDRVLELQQKEYGPHDRRCYVTIEKINIVKSRGTNFEQAVEELRKTFSLPVENAANEPSPTKDGKSAPNRTFHEHTIQKTKNQKNKVMKVLTSIRKKKPAIH